MISRVNKLNCIIEISRKWASKCRRKVEAHFFSDGMSNKGCG